MLSPTRSGPEGSSRNEFAPGRRRLPPVFLVAVPDAKVLTLLLVRAPIPKNPNIRRACACYSHAMDESETLGSRSRCAAAKGRSLSRAGAQIPPAGLHRPDRAGSAGAHAHQCLRHRPHRPCLHAHRRARRGQDDDRAHHRPRAQLHRAGRQAHRARPSIPAASAIPASPSPNRAMSMCRRWTPPPAPASTICARSSKACAMRRRRRATRSTSSTKCTCCRSRPSTALLKTLEEPPPHVKFIFATTEIRKVPVTVLSRCQRFDLRRIETRRACRASRRHRRRRKT